MKNSGTTLAGPVAGDTDKSVPFSIQDSSQLLPILCKVDERDSQTDNSPLPALPTNADHLGMYFTSISRVGDAGN
jgi:hypothetical protein